MLPPLNVIVDLDVATRAGWRPGDLARAYLAGGARFLQIRAKQIGSGAFLAICDEIVAAARASNATVIINDRPDLARLTGAGGVHVGQDDLPVAEARAIVGDDAIVGLSAHTAGQVEAALREPIDYLAVGPVFGTTTKETGYQAVGLELVRFASRLQRPARIAPLPVVAIGGITFERAPEVLAAGATSVAVISDLLATGDPEQRVRAYLERLASKDKGGTRNAEGGTHNVEGGRRKAKVGTPKCGTGGHNAYLAERRVGGPARRVQGPQR